MFWNCLNHLILFLGYSMQFGSIQLVPFCLVIFSLIFSFQFVNKWIHSFVKQFDQGEAAAKINSFTYDRQLAKLVVATTGDPYTNATPHEIDSRHQMRNFISILLVSYTSNYFYLCTS